MKLSLDGFLYQIKQIVTGKTGAYSTISPGGTAMAADGGIKHEVPLPLDTIVNPAATNPVITDSTGGVASATFAADSSYTVLSIPVAAESGFANAQVLNIKPGFNGNIIAINWHQGNVAATGSAAAATLTGQIATTPTTGGVVTLATADAVGAKKAGTTITGANAFTNTQDIGITVSAVTAFTAGTGNIELIVQNTDQAAALAQIAKVLNAQANQNSLADSSSVQAIIVPSGTNPTIGLFSLPVPRDYDEATDTYAIQVWAALANADAAITMTGTPTTLVGNTFATGTAVSATLPFKTAAAALTTSVVKYDINLNGLGLKRDTIITVSLALVGTTTGNTTIYAVEQVYASCIVSYNETDSTGVDGSLSEYGNPLR